jgi:tetratricopeptide (TPR) repeat protein
MAKKRHKHSAKPDKSPGRDNAASAPTSRVVGWKLWFFRLLAFIAAPAVFLALCELGLRLAGFGYPAEFLLPSFHNGRKTFIQNNKFGWRFFGPQLNRLPYPLSISQPKLPGTTRIFVFGESAAKGDPQPAFGLPQMLQAMLSLRHPGARFEVENAAMTAINSHVILPIARDCAAMDGDIWVIYMGNNEVVGPFGAGTVFGGQTPPLPLIRGALALKATRVGQLLDSLRQWMQKSSSRREWEGMEMFLNEQVRAKDPRMDAVYRNFARNLADIIQTGRQAGVGIVVSTVAVNLKDCAPFASEHRPGLSESARAKWEQFYQLGIAAQLAKNNEVAAARFREAAQIDDSFAELPFRQAGCALALGRISEARQDFLKARELDTLRFRCDNRLNELARQAASNRQPERVLLADAERACAEQSPDGLPGDNLFYEHVHLNFMGNYLLARTIAEQVEKLLPEPTVRSAAAARPWPSVADCARRLAWNDWSRMEDVEIILSRLQEPPFTGQLNHDAQWQHLLALLDQLRPATSPQGIRQALKSCEAALAQAPEDPSLLDQLACLQQLSGDLPATAATLRRSLDLLPSSEIDWELLGEILARLNQPEAAVDAFRRAIALDSQAVPPLVNLAQIVAALGRREEAVREYRRAVSVQPRFSLAWMGLGELYEKSGRQAEADECYHEALANHFFPWELVKLARFCQKHGWLEAAATNYAAAIQVNPSDAQLRMDAGQNLITLKRYAEAGGQFSEALQLQPELLEARLNLGLALMNLGREAEALARFEEVLQRSPTNAAALKAAQFLRAKSSSAAKR